MSSSDDKPLETTMGSPAFGPTASMTSPVAFRSGERLAGRYNVIRFVAEGGMGQVYEAEDLLLHERVALKIVHAHVAKDSRAVERFKREIQLARKVTHENVCRIFDVGIHEVGEGKEVAFLSMELLSGETLADRIRREGPLPLAEARAILGQLVAALSAAHRAGVVHRDFKSSNVILVPDGERVRAVVTDFGLARPDPESGQSAPSVTGTGDFVGSPHYMAPEQVEGGPITPAVDIYALGVVLYEMVTGELPFHADSALAVAVKRLKERPAPPKKHRADLDPRWDAVILRCLERAPAQRFAQVGDVLFALDDRPVIRRRWLVGGAAILAGAVAIAILAWTMRPHRPPAGAIASAEASAGRRAVAVLGFRNTGGRPDDAWLATALVEMLATELGAGNALRAIPGESVARMKKELALGDADGYAAETLSHIREASGADWVVVGSYLVVDDRVRLDARLQDTHTGETILQVAETAAKGELLELVARAGGRLRAPMGAGEPSATQRREARSLVPKQLDAQRAYLEGVQLAEVGECSRSEDRLRRAVELEPDFALSHAHLADAVHCLGREDEATSITKKALELSAGLPRRERLEIEAQYAGRIHDTAREAEALKTLHEFFPDDAKYALAVANDHLNHNRLDEAERVLTEVEKLPPPDGTSLNLRITQYQLARARGDRARARDVVVSGAREAAARGETANVALMRAFEGDLLIQDGEFPRAAEAFEDLRAASERIRDQDGVAWGLIAKGGALAGGGEIARGKKTIEEGLRLATEIGSRRRVPQAHAMLASIRMDLGDLEGAAKSCEALTPLSAELGFPQLEVGSKQCRSGIAIIRGDLATAERLLDEARALKTKLGMPLRGDSADRLRGMLGLERGDYEGARATLRQELADRDLGTVERADARLILILVELEAGALADAEREARETLATIQGLHAPRLEARTRAVLAMTLARQGRRGDAEAVLAPVDASKLEGIRDRAVVTIAVLDTRGDPASVEAARRLQRELEQAGMLGLSLRVRLRLAELEHDRLALAAVEKDARKHGLVGLAQKAASAKR